MMKKFMLWFLLCFNFIAIANPLKSLLASKHMINIENNISYECEVEWLESTGTQYILLENVLANGIDIYVLP